MLKMKEFCCDYIFLTFKGDIFCCLCNKSAMLSLLTRMRKIGRLIYILGILFATSLVSCVDDESFSSSEVCLLTFSKDTIEMDTLFSHVPSVTRSFWIYNHSDANLKFSVKLKDGNQSGFRVNVDGIDLVRNGFQFDGIEVRKNDSVRAYVELTAFQGGKKTPRKVSDALEFTLNGGKKQKVILNAWSWDAILLHSLNVNRDTILSSESPVVVYGGIHVAPGATLTIGAGERLFFHENAALTVEGTLRIEGNKEHRVTLRGDRLDCLFIDLSYDDTPGRWRGIRFSKDSYGNNINYADIHGAYDGIVCDTSAQRVDKLVLDHSIIHNCQGYGLKLYDSQINVQNCQITNAQNDCVMVDGGYVTFNNCTLAQFYPFSARRGAALHLIAGKSDWRLSVKNSIITGYGDDELKGEVGEDSTKWNYYFEDCMIRTPQVETSDSSHFVHVYYEDVKDTIQYGEKHFVNIDTKHFKYDFHLAKTSAAIGKGNRETSLPTDCTGRVRDEEPDLGCFEYKE
jgi:hypothetical protein